MSKFTENQIDDWRAVVSVRELNRQLDLCGDDTEEARRKVAEKMPVLSNGMPMRSIDEWLEKGYQIINSTRTAETFSRPWLSAQNFIEKLGLDEVKRRGGYLYVSDHSDAKPTTVRQVWYYLLSCMPAQEVQLVGSYRARMSAKVSAANGRKTGSSNGRDYKRQRNAFLLKEFHRLIDDRRGDKRLSKGAAYAKLAESFNLSVVYVKVIVRKGKETGYGCRQSHTDTMFDALNICEDLSWAEAEALGFQTLAVEADVSVQTIYRALSCLNDKRYDGGWSLPSKASNRAKSEIPDAPVATVPSVSNTPAVLPKEQEQTDKLRTFASQNIRRIYVNGEWHPVIGEMKMECVREEIPVFEEIKIETKEVERRVPVSFNPQ